MDNVNHPNHYEKSTSLECIDVMKLLLGDEGIAYFCIGNAFKYMWRYKNKNGLEDLRKAKWYLNYIEQNNNVYYSLNEYNAVLYHDLYILLDEKIDEFETEPAEKEDDKLIFCDDEGNSLESLKRKEKQWEQ